MYIYIYEVRAGNQNHTIFIVCKPTVVRHEIESFGAWKKKGRFIGKKQMQDADMESLKYDSATYADLVASQLQEERYATWVVDTENPSEKGMPWQGGFLYLFFFLLIFGPKQNPWYTVKSNGRMLGGFCFNGSNGRFSVLGVSAQLKAEYQGLHVLPPQTLNLYENLLAAKVSESNRAIETVLEGTFAAISCNRSIKRNKRRRRRPSNR